MFQPAPKRVAPFLLALAYFTTITLATFCSLSGLSGHSHHHAQKVAHSSTCLFACAAAAPQASEAASLSSFALLLFGALLFGEAVFYFQSPLFILPSRAPPRI